MSKHRGRRSDLNVRLPRFMHQKKKTYLRRRYSSEVDSSIKTPESPIFSCLCEKKNPSSLLALTRFPRRRTYDLMI